MKELLYQIWLSTRTGMTLDRAEQLLAHFGTFEQVYRAGRSDFAEQEHICDIYSQSMEQKGLDFVQRILEDCDREGIDIITGQDPRYPNRLKQISDAPVLLYCRGTMPPVDQAFTVGVVGARRPSIYGTRIATDLAADLGKLGAVIVSGMARGIDTAAHRGALRSDADTIAVLGCGVDRVYPPENRELKKLIEAHGAVLSEYPPGTKPLPHHFPARNRIISGLSAAVAIVEGKATSGSMITARLAQNQGREVFCVPGNIDSPLSSGPNQLIREGATLITGVQDMIMDYTRDYPQLMMDVMLGEEAQQRQDSRKLKKLPVDQQRVLGVLHKNHPTHIDDICFQAGMEAAVANQCLLMLEMDGLITQLPGSQYILS